MSPCVPRVVEPDPEIPSLYVYLLVCVSARVCVVCVCVCASVCEGRHLYKEGFLYRVERTL